MMTKEHCLLQRQRRRYLASLQGVPETIEGFITAVNNSYYQFERDYNLLERSMELSSRELIQAVAERKLAEEKIRRKNERLAALQRSTVLLMNTFDSEEIIHTILRDIVEITGAEHGFIVNWDANLESFSLKASVGAGEPWLGVSINKGQGVVGQVFDTEQIVIVEDYRCWEGRLPGILPDNVTTVIGAPLKVRQKVFGVIGLTYVDQPQVIDQETVEFIEQFAAAASVALDNARLYAVAQAELAERRRIEAELRHYSTHDSLTGLYNRNYFDTEMEKVNATGYETIGVVVFDIDGLKLVNDALGHASGDVMLSAAANIIKKTFADFCTPARIGGDEFAAIVKNVSRTTIVNLCKEVQANNVQYNARQQRFHLSMSIGFSISYNNKVDLWDLFKDADNNMYREKLHRGQSTRSAIVQTVMRLSETRTFMTRENAAHLQVLVRKMGKAKELSENVIVDIERLLQFYDIGNVGIPDQILFNPGPLDKEEWVEMRRHAEAGQRIALASPELISIADWIFKHHEWWNGQGYPLGLVGENIPLPCRMIAIVAAYDAMCNDRPYRKALGHQQALAEIKKGAGTQFEPELVELFFQMVHVVQLSKDECDSDEMDRIHNKFINLSSTC